MGLAAAFSPLRAQTAARVTEGPIQVFARFSGSTEAADLFQVRAPFEGRVEKMNVSTTTWYTPKDALAHLASVEMAALIDSRLSTPQDILEKRWEDVYQMFPVRCPQDCYVLRLFFKPKQWVEHERVLVEAARTVRLVGTPSGKESGRIQPKQPLYFWPKQNPALLLQSQVTRYEFNAAKPENSRVEVVLTPQNTLPPGTPFIGKIQVETGSKDTQTGVVPTQAVLRYKGKSYVIVQVETGKSTTAETEVRGVAIGREILVTTRDTIRNLEFGTGTTDLP